MHDVLTLPGERLIALYERENGRTRQYPMPAGSTVEDVPVSVTMKSGAVLKLLMITHCPEVSESDRATAHAMAVTS